MTETSTGLLISCDLFGVVKKVYQNNLGYNFNAAEGKIFTEFFEQEFKKKALDFIVKIKKNSISFHHELILKANRDVPIYFSGAIIENNIIILGSVTRIDLFRFLIEIMSINNELINTIRDNEKIKKISQKPTTIINTLYFNEMSRLNNELIDMQRELQKKNNELAQLNSLKNQFLGMAAHDLRNPLGYIIKFSEFLEDEKSNLSPEQIDFIEQIKFSSTYMLNLVTDLLDVSVIETGELNLRLETLDFVFLINNYLSHNKILAEKKYIKMYFNTSIHSLKLKLDRMKIEQVIDNLITNAIKYSYPYSEIEIGLILEREFITFFVKDQGQGILEDELNLLFKPFKKTSSKTTAGEKSTGLGLYIVKRIVEAHNGKIWVTSEYKNGSTFYFSLPINV